MTLGLVSLLLLVAVFRHDPFVETLLFALILTIAAIPVALPAVLSVTMAIGAEMLAKMQAIVSRLVAIEEMAGMDILCSDKTGTLTKNELTVGEPFLAGDRDENELLLAAALTSEISGADAIDRAINQRLGDGAMLKPYKILKFHPFDPVRKYADAEVQGEESFKVAKGAPQVILELSEPSESLRSQVKKQIEKLAERGTVPWE